MTISKRELQLSQDLMGLQSRYNGVIFEKNVISTVLKIAEKRVKELEENNERLGSENEILKEAVKSAIAFNPKKKIVGAK